MSALRVTLQVVFATVIFWLGSTEIAWPVDQQFVLLPIWTYHDYLLISLAVLALALIVMNIFRQRSARRLAKSERQLDEFFESSQDGFYRSDSEGRITWISPAVIKILGYEKLEDIIGQRIADHYADPEKRQLMLERIQQTGKVTDYEVELRRQDGSTVIVSTSSAYYRDKSGQVMGVEGVFRDITERKLAEQALKESELRYSSLVESTDTGIIAVDVHTREFLFVNKGMCHHLGFTQEEFLKQRIETMHPPDVVDDAIRALEDFISGGISVFSDLPFLHKDGSLRFFDVTGILLDFDGRDAVIGYFRNFTERHWGKKALKESEDFSRAVIEHSPIGVTVRSRTGKLLTYNKAWRNIWKISDEDLHNYTTRERYILRFDKRDSYLGDWTEKVRLIYEEGGYLHIPELEAKKTPQHEHLWLSQHFYALKDSSSLVDRVVILTEDITDRKQAEDALREGGERYRGIFDESIAVIYLFDAEKNFVDTNQSGLKLLGYSREELLRLNISDVDADHNEVAPAHKQLLSGERIVNFEHQLKRKDGRIITVLNNSMPLTDAQGSVIGLQSTLIDITERKQAEDALRESEERFRTLAEATPIALAVSNVDDGIIIYTNQAMDESLGYRQSELIGKDAGELYLNSGDRNMVINTLKDIGHVRNFETKIIRYDGSSVWGLISINPITFRGAPSHFVSFVDITERREVQQKLREAEEARYDQVKQIAGGVSHEIYNALFPAISCLAKLGDRLTDSSPEDLERNLRLLELTESAVDRAINMTDLVTRYSRLDSEKIEEAVALRPLLDEILESNAERIGDLGVELQVTVANDVVVNCSTSHLHSIFSNLLFNALDALEDEVMFRQIKIVASLENSWVKIRFIDNGPGISAEHRSQIFDPFYSTKPTRGTGLGLAIVKRILQLYDGRIELEPAVDKRTIFVIFLKSVQIDHSEGDK